MTSNSRPGLPKFTLDDDIAPPTPAQRASAKAEAERIGFVSENARPTPAVSAPAATPEPPPKRPARPMTYDTNFHIRTTAEDRERFDDFAWRHRITKGEAMRRILDLALAAEAAQSEQPR